MNNNYNFNPMIGQPISRQTRKNNKIFIILISIAALCIITGLFLFINQDKKESTNNENFDNSQVENNDTGPSNDLIEEYTGTKQDLVVATVGHVDHGKSTLTSAITKLYGKYKTVDEISMAPEVNKNGITYNASFVEYETAAKHYSHYDMPAHIDYIKSIISGALEIDGAILVVSATDGPMAQTREQLKLLQQAGVSRIVVYISKCDMVDDNELLSLVEEEIRVLISEYGFDENNTPVIRGSALKALEGDKDGEQSVHDLINSMNKWFVKRTANETVSSHKNFNAVVYVLTKEEGGRHTPFFNDHKLQISITTSKEKGTVTLPEGVEMVMPGDNVDMTITLEKAITFKNGDIIKMYEEDLLVGVGIVTEIIK